MSPGDSPRAEDRVRDLILSGGFDRVGYARADRAPDADHFDRWVERGHGADMAYLWRNRERRLDPREVVPGARTVIVVALHYRGKAGRSPSRPGEGKIATYARGEDYHRVMERRLKSLRPALTGEFPGHVFRYYVDTGPVLERAWAREAGVGWTGKNTCSIDSHRGSYFFLGSLITTLELEADAPLESHCGTCTLCLEVCPTDAFTGPFELDAGRCISYQTIEQRESTPVELRPGHEDWIFGCDLCQEVCPFNRVDRVEGDPELEPRPENESVSLASLARLNDEDAFRERFPRSPVRRARLDGLLRNVAYVAGNQPGAGEALEELERKAKTRPSHVREAIEWARERQDEQDSGLSDPESSSDIR